MPVYFNQDPVLQRGGGGFARIRRRPRRRLRLCGQNVTPNAVPVHISPYDVTPTDGRLRRAIAKPRTWR